MEVVNDKYWLDYAKSSIQKSITSRNEAAQKLQNMTLWLWGLYTTSFTIGITVNAIDAPFWVLLLLASPIVFLILSYWFCVLAQLPVTAEFDPRIPYEIKEGYNAGLKVKKSRLNIALSFTFVSALLLSLALTALCFVHEKEETSLTTFYDSKEKVLVLSGVLPKNIIAHTSIDTSQTGIRKASVWKNTYKVSDNGILNLNIPMDKLPERSLLTVTWEQDGKNEGLAQLIK